MISEQLLPTPQAHDSATPKTPEQIAEMRDRAPRRKAGGPPGISNLNEIVPQLLPTPNATDGKGASTTVGSPQRYRKDNGRPYGLGDANLPLAVEQLLPTPVAGEARHGSPNQHRTRGDTMLTGVIAGLAGAELSERREQLLATPQAYDGERGGPQPVAKRRAGGHAPTLQDQVHDLRGALLPTPSVSLATGGQTSRSGDRKGELLLGGIAQKMEVEWGVYEAAITRWEALRGIAAPCPVEPGQRGRPRLAPAFVEWMMGLPPGWVTEVPGLTRAQQLRLLGNGVVPQQVAHALRLLLIAFTIEA